MKYTEPKILGTQRIPSWFNTKKSAYLFITFKLQKRKEEMTILK